MNKIFKTIINYLFILMMTLTICSCKKGQNHEERKIELEQVTILEVGESLKLNYTLTNLSGIIMFDSSNEDVIIVDETGFITALTKGKSTITASVTYNDRVYSDSINIDVVETKHTHSTCDVCNKCISPDCTGSEEDKCKGHSVEEHNCLDYKSDWQFKDDFICGENVEQFIICLKCGTTIEKKTVDLEHNFETEVLKAKTCEEDGELKHTCTICEYSYTETDHSLGHVKDDIKIIVEATQNTLGTKQIKCKNCDYIYKEFNYVDNAYHRNGKLSVKNTDLVNQYGEKYQLYGLSTHGLQWFRRVVNFDTFCEIQENFGNNVIRLALYTDEDGYCDGSEATKKTMLETLHRGIDIATELGLYVIVDWHMCLFIKLYHKNTISSMNFDKVAGSSP